MESDNNHSLLDELVKAIVSNPGTKVVSVVIAAVLWSVVLLSRNVEATKEVPIEIITPADLVTANEIPEKVQFRLSGPKAFLRAILDRRDEPIRVNLAGGKPGLVTYRFFSDNIRLPIGVKVLAISPAALPIKLELLKRREVQVRPEFRGSPPEGFRIARTEIRPKLVRIRGAESRVDAVTEIPTLPVDVSELRQDLEQEVGLDIARLGVQLDGALPRLLVQVTPATANFKIKNIEVRVRSNLSSRVEERTVSVLVRIDPKDLKLLDRSRVFAEVNLLGKPKGKYTEPVKVTLPAAVALVKTIPERVNITLY